MKRDEHFRHEKKIIRFHIGIFLCCCLISLSILCDRVILSLKHEAERCNLFCNTMYTVQIARDIFLFILFAISVIRLSYNAKKRVNFLYREYRVTCLIQSSLVLIDIIVSITVNFLIVLEHDKSESEAEAERYLFYISLLLPPFMISMFPAKDVFSLFNKYPE